MSLRSPLGRVRGMGSAKEGVSHFWSQRLTAVALVPLSLWFVGSVVGLAGADYAHFHAWIALPCNTGLMILLIAAVFYHAELGLESVIEDYLPGEGARFLSVLAVKLAAVLLGVFAAMFVLHIAFVGG